MSRLMRLIAAVFMLSGLFVYANHIGVATEVLEAAGVPTDKIPFVISSAERANQIKKDATKAALDAARETEVAKAAEAKAKEVAAKKAEDAKKAAEAEARKIAEEKAAEIKAGLKKPTAAPKPAPTKPKANKYGEVLTVAKSLPVKGRAPKTGYSRDQFGSAWTDAVAVQFGRNGCDTRNDILKRDLTGVTFKPGTGNCKVLTGTLAYEPYTGAKNVKFIAGGAYANQLDAEHIVALGDAWAKGAQQISKAKRTELANDPINLMMVDPSSNRAKGDADAATWLPANKSYRCDYIAAQVAVKKKYGLWVTKAESGAMVKILSAC